MQDPSHPSYGLKTINHIYLDCTFCYTKAQGLPTRDECMDLIFSHVKRWINQGPNFTIFLSLAARFGSEFLFMELFKKFGLKVHVSQFKYEIYKSIPELRRLITLNPLDTQIHACDDNNV